MSVRVSMTRCDIPAMAARVSAAKQAALFIVATQVKADATPKVPMSMQDTHTNLRESGRAHPTTDGAAEVEWGGDGDTIRYARAQHRGTNGIVTFRNYTTPGTGSDWTGKAESERAGAWRAMFASEMARRLHG